MTRKKGKKGNGSNKKTNANIKKITNENSSYSKRINTKTIVLLMATIVFAGIAYVFYPDTIFKTVPGDNSKVFSLIPASHTGVTFENTVNDAPDRGLQFFDYFYNGGGLAIGDINNDQLPDLFFTGNDVPNRLYINKGNFQFEDISQQAGIQNNKWSTGATLIDINQDGWLDIYVCNSGPFLNAESTTNELYINNGNNTFTEQAKSYGIADGSRSIQASFFDMDKDGDLDLWVMNHALRKRGKGSPQWIERAKKLAPQEYNRECSTLYRNDGNNRFTDISKAAGIQKIGFGLGLAVRDFDDDGLLDVYVANDYFIPDFMWINNGDGTFTDQSNNKLKHSPYYAMGCDASDFNNDGLTDLVVVDMTPGDHVRNKVLMASMDVRGFEYLTETQQYTPQYMYNSLFVNQGKGQLSDIALMAGVSQTDWSWAPLFADFDNDGWKDLMITNGFRKDTKDNDWLNSLAKIRKEKGANYKPADYFNHLKKASVNPIPNQIFKNNDGLNFQAKTAEWGFEAPSASNGAAYADLDQDGDLDIVINNFDQPAFLYQNNSRERDDGHFIRFKLTDSSPSKSAMHAKICLYYETEIQCNDNAFTRGYQSYVEPIVHFGLGQKTNIDRVEITWMDGQQSIIANPSLDKVHTIDKQKTTLRQAKNEDVNTLFKNITQQSIVPLFKHKENDFDDFEKEILLPHRQSMLGPALTVGDVNGDDLEDFYIGGAKDQAGAIYTQNNNGTFNLQSINAFSSDLGYEDNGAQFLDIDNDNDLDLYVASGGGGAFEGNEKMLQDRLYLNDGKGHFKLAKGRLPNIRSSTKTIAPLDWDKDGDLDLFVGGRTSPGKYPSPPRSYLLTNQNGTFEDQTEKLSPELAQIGMITGASWADIDNDQLTDLILVGEWMPISIFKQTASGFSNQTGDFDLEDTKGWWASLSQGDFDNDGDIDFIAGNIGLNNKFHPSVEKPLYVYANDFDENGTLDVVLSKIYKDQKVPVRGKECSSTQMPFIKEKFPTYAAFANANLESIYEPENLNTAIKYEAYNFASMYLENNGENGFYLSELPTEAQLAPINGIISKDFDQDGKMDLVLGGNNMQTEVETPSYDAGKGLFLKGLGNAKFETSLRIADSGLFLHQDVKDLQLIHLGKEKRPALLVANNNDALELYLYVKQN